MESPKKISISSDAIYKVHVLSTNANTNTIIVFGRNTVDSTNINTLFSEVELEEITRKNTRIVYSEFLIHKDDSIGILKKKIIHALGLNAICYDEMYLFTSTLDTVNVLALYNFLTEDDTSPITKPVLEQLLFNFNLTETEIENAFTKLGEKDNYTYEDLGILFQENTSYVFSIPLGIRFLNKTDFLFSANPYKLGGQRTESGPHEMSGLLRENKYTLATFENELLLNYPNMYGNNIYVCLTEDVISHTDSLDIDEELILKTYFPILYTNDRVRTLEDYQQIRQKLLMENAAIVNDKTLTVYRSISMLYDVYNKRTEDIQYIHNGIGEIELKIESDIQNQLPLEIIFKNIHASKEVPFIKYNPGSRSENIYRFYTEQHTNTGKNIPYLTETVIMRLSKEIGKSKEIAFYVLYTDSETNVAYNIYVTIQMDGDVYVKIPLPSPTTIDRLTDILKISLNPIFKEINGNIQQNIFRTIDTLQNKYIHIVDLKYILELNIDKELKINKYAGCITSVFDIMNIDDHYNITLRYKRVENFKEMNAIQNLISNAFKHVNKNMDDISYVMNELMKNYGLTEEAANTAILQFLGDHRDIQGEIVDNPGFDVFIQNRLDNKVKIEVNHVLSIEYIDVLFTYLDTIIRMSQYPDKTTVNKKEFFSLCTKVEKIGKKIEERRIENVITTNFEPVTQINPQKMKMMKPIGIDSESDEDESDMEDNGIFFDEEEEEEEDASIAVHSETGSKTPAYTPSQIVESSPSPPVDSITSVTLVEETEKIPSIPKPTISIHPPASTIASVSKENSSKSNSISSSSSSSSSSSDDKGLFYDENDEDSTPSVEKVPSPSPTPSPPTPSEVGPKPKSVFAKGGNEEMDIGEDAEQLEFMKKKLVGKPIAFLEKMKAKDPAIFVTEKDKNYEGYARICQRKRQPVSLTKDEFNKLDKSTYTNAMRYGSDPNNPNYYVCPRYWCLLSNTSMTLDDVKAGKCAKQGVPDKIIPTGETIVPKDAFVYDFTDNGKLKYENPGFMTGKHPKGLCLPCCFIKPNQGKKECHQPELDEDEPTATTIEKPRATKTAVKTKKVVIQEDASVAMEKEGNINYIISNETFPIKQKNRFGFLPYSVQLFLQTDNTKAVTKDNPAYIRPNTDCFLRYGVEQAKNKSILGSIVDLYAYRQGLVSAPSVNDFVNKVIPDAVTIDDFIRYHNGNLVSVFKTKEKKETDVDFSKYENTLFFKKIDINDEYQYSFLKETVRSYENFIRFLQDENSIVDYTYIWDMITEDNPKLIKGGINLVIMDIVNNDITDKIEIICPTHSRNKIYDSKKETFFLIKKNRSYEPVVLYKKVEEGIQVKRTFSVNLPFKNIQKTLQTIDRMKNKYCAHLPSLPTIYKFKKNLDLRELVTEIKLANWYIDKQVMNYQGKIIGVLATKTEPSSETTPGSKPASSAVFVPCSPSSAIREMGNIESIFMDDDEKLWVDYKTTVYLLKEIKENSGGKILSLPKFKVLEDKLIVGILTETNQFVQIMPPSEDIGPDELTPIDSDNPNTADKVLTVKDTPDKERVNMIRNITLEHNFYHLFRKTIRQHMNLYENRVYKERIIEIYENQNYLYRQKLKKIIELLKNMEKDKIVFEELPIELLTDYENLACLSTNCKEESYCIQKEDGVCQLVIPKKHLISQLNNEEVYYTRIADELVRYNRIRIFMMQPKKYLHVSSSEYKIEEDEFLLLQSVLTPEYFKDLVPYNINEYVRNTNYSTAMPQISQTYSNDVISMKEQTVETETETEHLTRSLIDCIKGKIEVIGNTRDSMWKRIFPKNAKEMEFKNTSANCSFAILIYIFQTKYNKEITVKNIRRSLSVKYTELFKKNESRILEIWKKSGKLRIVNLIKEKKASVETVIMSDEYYLTDLDIWIFSVISQLQICIFNRNLLKGLNEKLEWLITNNRYEDPHFFIRSPALKGSNVIPSYNLVVPTYKINELKEFEPIVQNAISGRNVEYRQNVQSIVEFLGSG
jgi:hypothetical protein